MVRCQNTECQKIELFGLYGKKAIYCKSHKQDNMIDVKHKNCIKEGCNIRPNYNLASETKPIYCFEHKTENMIDIINKRCIEEGCKYSRNFNFPNEKKLFIVQFIRKKI